MSQIVFIAFYEEKFKNHVNCAKWIRERQDYENLLNNKKWRLKAVAKSYWMSEEGCKVFQWQSPKLAYVKQICFERPEPGVLVGRNVSSQWYTETDCPPLSNKYQRKRREAEFVLALKDQKRLDKDDERKQKKRKRETLAKKVRETLPSKSLAATDENGHSGRSIKHRIPKKKKSSSVPSNPLEENPLPPLVLSTEETQAIDKMLTSSVGMELL